MRFVDYSLHQTEGSRRVYNGRLEHRHSVLVDRLPLSVLEDESAVRHQIEHKQGLSQRQNEQFLPSLAIRCCLWLQRRHLILLRNSITVIGNDAAILVFDAATLFCYLSHQHIQGL